MPPVLAKCSPSPFPIGTSSRQSEFPIRNTRESSSIRLRLAVPLPQFAKRDTETNGGRQRFTDRLPDLGVGATEWTTSRLLYIDDRRSASQRIQRFLDRSHAD